MRPFARTLGSTFIGGGVLAGGWLLFPEHAPRRSELIAVLAVLAVVIGAALLSPVAERASHKVPSAMLAVGQLEITLATWLSGDIRTGIVTFFAWIPALSFRYMSARGAWLQSGLTAILVVVLTVVTPYPQRVAERAGYALLFAGSLAVIIFLVRRLIAESAAIERRGSARLQERAAQQTLVAAFGHRALDGLGQQELVQEMLTSARAGLRPTLGVEILHDDADLPPDTVGLFDVGNGVRLCVTDPARSAFAADDEAFLAGLVAVARAGMSRREIELQMRHDARHDPLTSLPNRTMIFERLAASLHAARRTGKPLAVMLMDLDDFKSVNDSMGHHTGDLLLQSVTRRLLAGLRGDDMLGRLGGDEFVVVCDDTDASEAFALAERLVRGFAEPLLVGGASMTSTGSIGIAVADGSSTAETMLAQADAAMYAAKSAGRSRIAVFDESLTSHVQDRLDREAELRLAVRQGRLEVHYQPVVRLADGQVEGYEALARWNHPRFGNVPADSFIEMAEELGIVGAIDLFVLETACRVAAADPAGDDRYMAVNVSPQDFVDAACTDRILAALRRAGLPPHRLQVEVTETMLIAPGSPAESALSGLRAEGVRIALDDFGKGFSWLGHLGRLPLDVLKVDRSLVAEIVDSRRAVAIVGSVVALGRELGLQVVAEGVEHAAQRDVLRELGCDGGQGYLFGWPAPVAVLGPSQVT